MDEDSRRVVASAGEVMNGNEIPINAERKRFPYCIVWTPIPLLSWLFPFIGHMGIAYSSGVIRDFAGPYYVSEDDMAFGQPTKYWQLNPMKVMASAWDQAVSEASEEYKTRMVGFVCGLLLVNHYKLFFFALVLSWYLVHNLCCDNCHSHVAMALNLMRYNNSSAWNMIWMALYMMLYGKYVSFLGFLKTWVPFAIIASIVVAVSLYVKL